MVLPASAPVKLNINPDTRDPVTTTLPEPIAGMRAKASCRRSAKTASGRGKLLVSKVKTDCPTPSNSSTYLPSRVNAPTVSVIFIRIFASVVWPPSVMLEVSVPSVACANTSFSIGWAYFAFSLMNEKSPLRLPIPSTAKSKLPATDNSFSAKLALRVPEPVKPVTPVTDPTPDTDPVTPEFVT